MPGGSPNVTEPGVCPGAWSTTNSTPARVTVIPSASSRTSSGSVKVSPPNNCWSAPSGRAPARVRQQDPVVGVDVGRDVSGPAQRRYRPDVVQVAVGGDRGDRLEPVRSQDLLDPVERVLTGVHDDAFL